MRWIPVLGLLVLLLAASCAGSADDPSRPVATAGSPTSEGGDGGTITPSSSPASAGEACNAEDPPRLVSYDPTTGEQTSERVVPEWPSFEFVLVDGAPLIPIVDGGIELAYRQPDHGPWINDSGTEVWFLRSWGLQAWAVPIDFDATFTRLDEVIEGDDEVVVLVGSDLGPDHRLLVLEADDGSVRWSLDGVRGAAPAAAGGIIYDRRVPTEDMNDDLTREVVVVEDHDPEAVRWTRRSAGELGGFIGTV